MAVDGRGALDLIGIRCEPDGLLADRLCIHRQSQSGRRKRKTRDGFEARLG
jgi:hypothetical protein